MHFRAAVVFVFTLTITASAQPNEAEALRLRDSASYYWRRDVDKTLAFANEAEAQLSRGQQAHMTEELYLLRFSTCRYFFRLKEARGFVEQYASFVKASKDLLGNDYLRQLEESKLWLAEYYYEVSNYEKSLTQFISSVAGLNKLPPSIKTYGSLYRAMHAMASIQLAKGEYEAAVNQFLAVKKYSDYIDKEMNLAEHLRHHDDMLINRNIAQALLKKQDHRRAKQYLDMALHNFKSIAPPQMKELSGTTTIAMFETLSTYYRSVGKNDSALYALTQTFPLLAYNEPFRSRVYKGLGDVYAGMRKYRQAQKYYEDAIALKQNEGESKSIPLSGMWLAMGNLYEQQGSVNEAIKSYYRSVNCLIIDRSENDESLPVLNGILAKKNLFTSLHYLSGLHFLNFKNANDDRSLDKAWDISKLSIALLDSAMNEVGLQKDKVIVAEQTFSAYENAIRIGFEKFRITGDDRYLEECFLLTDKSKGSVLLENLRTVNSFAGVDPVWFDRERELQSELSLMEQSLHKLEVDPGKDSTGLHEIRASFAARKHEYSELLETLQLKAPEYYKLRFDHSVLPTASIQKDLLKTNEGLITFFVGDSTLTVFGFSKTKNHFSHTSLPKELHAIINLSRSALVDPDQNHDQLARANLQELFDVLLADCLNVFGSSINSLIIVPDGVLGYVPFEVLPSPKNNNYLVDDYQVRYAHSVTYLFEQNRKVPANADNFFGGFISSGGNAPPSNARVDGVLQYAKEEVESIAEMMHEPLIFNPATKSDFIASASNFRLLHLAMHSIVNDHDPMQSVMVFSSNKQDSTDQHLLTALELYNLKLNADLAVLSACNTGSGELRRGEGVMSFSRAFSYAGVPSALISLWKVPDKATSKIMWGFYTHLKAGATKSEALRKAKVEFVEKYPAMKHPYYWSGFILAGNNDPIEFPSLDWWKYAIAVGTLVLIALVGIRTILLRSGKSKI
jgi:CHAT domain-containing protein